jgi:cytochrome b561
MGANGMMEYWMYLGAFIFSLLVLGIFYRNTRKNGVISFYFFFFAFTTYTILCNLFFSIPVNGYFLSFYVAQTLYVLSFISKKKGQKQKFAQKKQQVKLPRRRRPPEEKRQYMAQ